VVVDDRGQVKGYSLLSYIVPLRQEKSELWGRIEQKMTEDSRVFFAGQLYANHWYPRAHLHALMQAFNESVGAGVEEELRQLGGMAARYQLHVIYRMFLKLATPALVFNRASSVWSRQTTVGSFKVLEEHDDHLIGELYDPDLPRGMADLIAGWSDTIIALLGRTPYRTTYEKASPTRWRFRVSWVKR
jgi:hypothetical protein